MQEENKMETLVERLNDLTKKGYEAQFKIRESKLCSTDEECKYNPSQVKIDEFFRYEGETDPGQMAIVYAISTDDGRKGTLINGFGTYSDSDIDQFVQKIKEVHKGEIY